MKLDRLLLQLSTYDLQLADSGFEIEYVDDLAKLASGGPLGHVRWMIHQILEHPQDFDEVKAFTWLGFIQGCLWMAGKEGILDMRKHNRWIKGKDNGLS